MDAELRRLTGKRDEYNEKQEWGKADKIQAQIDIYKRAQQPQPDPRVQPGPDERHAKPQ